MEKNSGRKSDLSTLTSFCKALELALYDKILEQSGGVLVYAYDADVVIDVILGLTAWDASAPAPDVASWPFVSRALVSTGYLPKVRFLRPHLVEFDRFIEKIPVPPIGREFRNESLRMLAQHWDLARHEKSLREGSSSVEGLRKFIGEEGFSVFVKLELCFGGLAHDRLMRFAKSMSISPISDYSRINVDDKLAHELADRLAAKRTETFPAKRLANRADGYALAELARSIASGKAVRFHTQTEALNSISKDEEFLDARGHTVFRDHEYFVVRASFPVLGFGLDSVDAESFTTPDFPVEHIREISVRLGEILEGARQGMSNLDLERALQATKVNGHSLDLIMESFQRLKFLGSVFLRWGASPSMSSLMPFLQEVFGSRKDLVEGARKVLREDFAQVTSALDSSVGRLRDWRIEFFEIRRAVDRVGKKWETRPTRWRDLGLGRWALRVHLPEVVQVRLDEWTEIISDADMHDREISDLALTVARRGYRSKEEFALAICVLWVLKLEKTLVREWEEGDSEELRESMPGLYALYLVARVKLARKVDEDVEVGVKDEIEVAVELSRKFSRRSFEDRLRRACAEMTLAHVAYWAWQRSIELADSDAETRYAFESFSASERAAEILDPGSLMWLFAINNSAYVGIRSGVEPFKTRRRLEELGRVQNEDYHYRFADTRARKFTEQVQLKCRQIGNEKLVSGREYLPVRRELCESLSEASRILMSGKPWFGDIEVVRHWELVQELKLDIDCAGAAFPEPA